MDEISNKTLAILLIGAIVISLGGTLISLNKLTGIKTQKITGFMTDDANVMLQIPSLVEVTWMGDAVIDWDTGRVNSNASGCTLQSFVPSIGTNCTGFVAQNDGLILENTGTVNASLTIITGKSATQFIDGTNPIYQWKINNDQPGSCINASGFDFDTFYDATQGAPGEREVCDIFRYNDNNDSLRLDVKVWIPGDAVGTKSDTITATAEQV